MRSEEKRALSRARLEHAEQCLLSAKALVEAGDFRGAANRSYYAVFHAMRAVLALDEIDMKRHSGIISEFRRLYVKPGIFSTELSEIISLLFDARSASDYDDFYIVSKAEVAEQVENAAIFLQAVRTYLTA